MGVPYKGTIRNTDYRFSATVPNNLTGWGAAPGAPFHGFIIYLNKSSCINFNIAMRVDLPEDAPPPPMASREATPVPVGNRVGLQTKTIGMIEGVGFENVRVTLELAHGTRKDDIEITLVAPSAHRHIALRVFRQFLRDFKFW
jgi:hypothetical protein